jgi:6-phosphofructokinase
VPKEKLGILVGGGPAPGINSVISAATIRALLQGVEVLGIRDGFDRLMKGRLEDIRPLQLGDVSRIHFTGGSFLGTSRANPTKREEDLTIVFESLQRLGITQLITIGGDDTAFSAMKVSEKAAGRLRVVHVPKTIDNDLVGTDHCPGFGSAAKFVAQAFAGANQDNRALPGVYIAVVMGRHAGFLTAASALGRKFADDGPHLIYLPERAFDADKFVADVQKVYDKHGRCIVAVSEGVSDKSGTPIITSLKGAEKDSHGNLQLSGTGALGDLLADLVKAKTKIKRIRADTLGYLQRSFLGCISQTDAEEARAVGQKAVQFAALHGADGSVAIKRVGDYAVTYDLIPLESVAAKTRHMDDAFINAEGNDVTEAFFRYCRPLAGELPTQDRIQAPAVAKIK